MRLMSKVHIVGSGRHGLGITNPLDCNVYLLRGRAGHVLIDAGSGLEAERILETVRDDGLDPSEIETILLTHVHADHAGGAARLAKLTGASVVASSLTAEILESGDEAASGLESARTARIYPPDYRIAPQSVAMRVADGERLSIAGFEITILATPGHSDDHVSFLLEVDGRTVLFAGDTVFHSGHILLQNVPDCRIAEYARTAERLAELDVEVLLPGHMTMALSDGRVHLQAAARVFRSLGIPRNVI